MNYNKLNSKQAIKKNRNSKHYY